jgi:cysteine-rich CWC protein
VVMVLSSMNTQTCESCGREFACGADEERCWCREVRTTREQLAILREHFERCLCPDCLRAAVHDPLHSG